MSTWTWRRGRDEWMPLIPPRFRWPILILWVLEPITRGLDYITGDSPGTTTSLTFIEQAMPLQAWGALCLIGGVGITVGFIWRSPIIRLGGLHIAGATYATLTIGLAARTIERGGDGFRTPTMFAIFALTYWCAALGYAVAERDAKATEQ